MKHTITILGFSLLLLFAAVASAETGEGAESVSLWMGGHYTDFKDYTPKVGEYRLESDEFFPEFKLNYYSQNGSSIFRLDGHYFDYENVNGRLKTKTGDRFKAEFQYRSMTNNKGMDLLENMAAREWLGSGPGGKYVTYEYLDDVTAFSTHRQEVSGKAELLLSRKNDVRFIAAHRMIRETGNAQETGSTHCFNCHVASQSVDVEKLTNSFKAGLEGEALQQKLAYTFGYRKFESRGPDAYFYYDDAKHPVNGGAGAEFGSRQIFDDVTLPINQFPETEKMSHKITSKGKMGLANYAAALFYSRVENKKINFTGDELVSEAFGGKVNMTAPLSKKSRLIAKLGFNSIDNTDPFIDIPPYREGLWDTIDAPSFDYKRYSALDRTNFDGSAEVITRLNPKMTLALLGGVESVSRTDYPEIDGDNTSTTLIGQVNFKYRKGLRYSTRLKYRLEKTSDPFTSGRGLFEAIGNDILTGPYPGSSFIFYFQREDLRYQSITTEPTIKHEFEFSTSYRPSNKVNLLAGLKVMMDKNNDLDSLDVEHTMFQPNVNLTLTPDPSWIMVAGYTYNQTKSRGPVTVPLFDG